MPSTTLTIGQLALSPLNVRTYAPDAEDTRALQASILADGLLNPITVHPMRGSKTKWGAIAGGRRYRAIKALIANGDLPNDYLVRVNVLDGLSDAELVEHSITENLVRKDLRDHELFAGIASAAARGHDVEQIARGIGQHDVAVVERWLRMGRLAKPVFEALRAGTITDKQASAFAATEDQELQRVTFERFAPVNSHAPTPAEIRKAMNVGDIRAQRDLAFVGADAYRAAGGRFELDLFAEEEGERGRIVDAGKLQQLVDEKLGDIRIQVRESTSRPDLRFIAEKPKGEYAGSVDHQLAVSPKGDAASGLELPEGDIVAHIAIDASGQPLVSYWWSSRKAKFGSEKKPAATVVVPPATPTAPIGESAFAAHHRAIEATPADDHLKPDALFALSAVRKMILRAGLIENVSLDEAVGVDLLVWSQARALLKPGSRLGIRTIAAEDTGAISNDAFALARELAGATEASRVCNQAIAQISRWPFITEDDLTVAFADFCNAGEPIKRLAAAVVAGMALDRSLAAPGYERPLHDEVARRAGIETDGCIRYYWAPTGDMLDLLPKAQRLAIAEPMVDRATIATWAKIKSSELTSAVLALLTRAGSKGASWVHPLLRFTTTQQHDVREAAE